MDEHAVEVEGHPAHVGQIDADALDEHHHRLQQVAQQRDAVAHRHPVPQARVGHHAAAAATHAATHAAAAAATPSAAHAHPTAIDAARAPATTNPR